MNRTLLVAVGVLVVVTMAASMAVRPLCNTPGNFCGHCAPCNMQNGECDCPDFTDVEADPLCRVLRQGHGELDTSNHNLTGSEFK